MHLICSMFLYHSAFQYTNLHGILKGLDQIWYTVFIEGIKCLKILLESKSGNNGNTILKQMNKVKIEYTVPSSI